MAGTPPLLLAIFPCPKIPIQLAVYCSTDATRTELIRGELKQTYLTDRDNEGYSDCPIIYLPYKLKISISLKLFK